jgi:hypothetical protein
MAKPGGLSFLLVQRLQIADILFEVVDGASKPGNVDRNNSVNIR